MYRGFALLFLFLFSVLPAPAQRGALTVHQNLEQLTSEAALVVRARVMSTQVEPHPQFAGLTTVVVRLQITETYKGAGRRNYTFRQYVWDVRDRAEGAIYRKGEELILFLNAPNRYGLSAPVGLEQGRFRILRDESGREVAVNGRDNHRLLEGTSAASARTAARRGLRAHRQGPIAVYDLKELIRGAREVRR